MRKLILLVAAVAAAWAVPIAPAIAQPAATVVDQLQTLGAWVRSIFDALAPVNAAQSGLMAKIKPLMEARDPEALRANAPAVRAANAEVRQAITRSQDLLAAIRPFEGAVPGLPGAQVNRVLTDARDQLAQLRRYLDDVDAMMAAVERRDVQAVRAALPKVSRGGLLILKSQTAMYRARQALVPPDRSTHQAAETTITLYETMSAAAEAWYMARTEGQAAQAAAAQRTRFLALADQLERTVRLGRANAAREAEALAVERKKHEEADAQALFRGVDRMTQVTGRFFEEGDALVAWLRARASTSGPTLAAQTAPELIQQLAAFEQRLIANAAAAATVAAEIGR